MTNQLVLNEVNMGIDIFPIYQSSIYANRPPEFNILYMEYQAKMVEKENNLPKEYIANQLRILNGDIYTPGEMDIPTFSIRPKPELFNFLKLSGYSFQHEHHFFNLPIKEVW